VEEKEGRSKRKPEPEFDLSGGAVCLDFANTVSERGLPNRLFDYLNGYDDLIIFARDEDILSPQEARKLLRFSESKPWDRARIHRTAMGLRKAIYRVFAAAVQAQAATSKDLETIEKFARKAMTHRHLAYSGREYRWEWKYDKNEILSWVLWPIAQSAVELLTSERLKKVRRCAAPTCAWLFLDESRNHSRRWCDMTVCGNRQKARRHYQKSCQ
jgi:predicted RNA-binding Zn ribbon-like protein